MAIKPRCHTNEDKYEDNKKVYNTKKVLFVDSHGVKSFPYHGRRTHFSGINKFLVAAETATMICLEWLSFKLRGNIKLA